jgi:hypothetical protein
MVVVNDGTLFWISVAVAVGDGVLLFAPLTLLVEKQLPIL